MSTTTTDKPHDGGSCPHCGSGDLTGGDVEIDTGIAWQPVTCDTCGAGWNDQYKLVGFVSTQEPTRPGSNVLDTIEYSVCQDCLLCLANGISEEAPDEHDKAFGVGVDRELDGKSGHFVCGVAATEDDPEGSGYEEFGTGECELCRSTLAGSRHGATLILTKE